MLAETVLREIAKIQPKHQKQKFIDECGRNLDLYEFPHKNRSNVTEDQTFNDLVTAWVIAHKETVLLVCDSNSEFLFNEMAIMADSSCKDFAHRMTEALSDWSTGAQIQQLFTEFPFRLPKEDDLNKMMDFNPSKKKALISHVVECFFKQFKELVLE